ncbi:TPA: hypothetical protein ACHWKK_002764 [Providencia stuartii]|uniref:hypothetical protein n=1 Tax=Providencia stuartii TaxID=588 RepID=UPI002DBE8D12|nr:hypothetical protein [Providencia stuartii]WRV52054.1 hypothetical protein VQ573_00765 [Providencia stuartii]
MPTISPSTTMRSTVEHRSNIQANESTHTLLNVMNGALNIGDSSPIQMGKRINFFASSKVLHRELDSAKANNLFTLLKNSSDNLVAKYHLTPDMIVNVLREDKNNINAVLTSFSLLSKDEIPSSVLNSLAKNIAVMSKSSAEVSSKTLSSELFNLLPKFESKLQTRFLSEYVTPAIKAKLNETYTDSQLKQMAGLDSAQQIDDTTLVNHFLNPTLVQEKLTGFERGVKSSQELKSWSNKNYRLNQCFQNLEEHIEIILVNKLSVPSADHAPVQMKPKATRQEQPTLLTNPQQSDDVDGVPYQTSSQTSAPIINNYYITNNYACPHCICKVSDTPSRYGSVATTVNIDSAASFQAAPSKTIAQKTATPAAETPTTYRTELHVQLSGDGKIVKQDSPTPPNNATQVDDSASHQPALKDKSSGETSESTEPQTGVNEAILLQSNQEKEAPELPPRHQMGGYTRTIDGKWLPNTQQTAPFVITSGGFNQSTNPVGRLQYSASDSKVESAKPTDQQLIAAQRQRAVDGIDSQSLEEQVTQQTDHLFDAQIQPNSHSHLVDAAKQVATELSNMLDVANRSAMVLKDTSLAAEQATRQLDTQQSLDDKEKPAVQSKASFPLSSHASGIYHAKVAQVVEEQPTATVVIEKESAEPVGAQPIHYTETTEKKADSDVTKKKYRWQVNTDNRVYTTSGGQARDLSQKKRYIGDDQRFKLGNGS